jgi:hypothetical protein
MNRTPTARVPISSAASSVPAWTPGVRRWSCGAACSDLGRDVPDTTVGGMGQIEAGTEDTALLCPRHSQSRLSGSALRRAAGSNPALHSR